MAKAKTIDQKGMGFEPTWNDTEVTTASAVIKHLTGTTISMDTKKQKNTFVNTLQSRVKKMLLNLSRKQKIMM